MTLAEVRTCIFRGYGHVCGKPATGTVTFDLPAEDWPDKGYRVAETARRQVAPLCAEHMNLLVGPVVPAFLAYKTER